MNRAIDDLIESARLFGGTQAKRGFGVYTQDDAIMEHSFWEGVEARAKAIRDEVAALKAERDAVMKDAERYRWLRDVWMDYKPAGYDGRNVGRFDLVLDYPVDNLDAAIDAAIAKAEGGAA